MAAVPHAFDYLAQKTPSGTPPVCVAFGDEPFLQRMVIDRIRKQVQPGEEDEFSFRSFDGCTAELRSVLDELATVSLFGGGTRLVRLFDADDFVSKHRPALEKYVTKPCSTGILVLEVRAWPSNTRLYKMVAASGLAVDCNAPSAAKLTKWLSSWADHRHQRKLASAAAQQLVELVGTELGLLDQELSKLAGASATSREITVDLVRDLVGGWRARTTWDMLDAAAAGNSPEALRQLDRLLTAGSNEVGLFAQISYTLRQFAAATRKIEESQVDGRRLSLRDALVQAGAKNTPFILDKAEAQLRQIGRERGARLYAWLLEADLGLKGNSHLPARAVLEQLLVRLSSVLQPVRGSPSARPGLAGRANQPA